MWRVQYSHPYSFKSPISEEFFMILCPFLLSLFARTYCRNDNAGESAVTMPFAASEISIFFISFLLTNTSNLYNFRYRPSFSLSSSQLKALRIIKSQCRRFKQIPLISSHTQSTYPLFASHSSSLRLHF